MADPLSLLREFTKNKKSVTLEKDSFIFEHITYPRSTPTSFRSQKGTKAPYTLDAIWFMLQNSEMKYTDYLSECKKFKFPSVSLIDKKELVSYLNGEIDVCQSISTLPVELEVPNVLQFSNQQEQDERANKKQKIIVAEEEADEDSIRKEKERIALNIDAPKLKTGDKVIKDNTLAPEFKTEDLEKWKDLKRRRDRVSIKDADVVPSQTKSKFVEMDAVVIKEIIQRERLLQTRDSILQTKNKKHFTSILDGALASMKKDEQQKKAEQKKVVERSSANSYDRYGEVEEQKFWKERLKGNEHDEWQIDTRGTFADRVKIPETPISKPKPTKEKLENIDKGPRNVTPIIIVPNGFTSPFTLLNAYDFLQNSTYNLPSEKKNIGNKGNVTIERKKKNGQVAHYQVVDSTIRFSPKDWDRVVAVFVFGQTWQFKGWKWETPVDLFSHIPGFFLHLEEEKLPEIVKSWDVKILNISKSKTKKHLSQTAVLEFWDSVEYFCSTKKSWLNY